MTAQNVMLENKKSKCDFAYHWSGKPDRHSGGCAFAALATITNQSYEEVAAAFPDNQPPNSGPTEREVIEYLIDRGYKISSTNTAPIYLCIVKAHKEDTSNHAVVQLEGGVVWDSNDKIPYTKHCLEDYYQVIRVYGVTNSTGKE